MSYCMHKMPISRFGSKMKRKKIYSSFVNHQEQNKHFSLPCYKEIEFFPPLSAIRTVVLMTPQSYKIAHWLTGFPKMLRSKKLAHFPIQFKEIFVVYIGVIGYIADPCDNF